jgi:hypothetical protein
MNKKHLIIGLIIVLAGCSISNPSTSKVKKDTVGVAVVKKDTSKVKVKKDSTVKKSH